MMQRLPADLMQWNDFIRELADINPSYGDLGDIEEDIAQLQIAVVIAKNAADAAQVTADAALLLAQQAIDAAEASAATNKEIIFLGEWI